MTFDILMFAVAVRQTVKAALGWPEHRSAVVEVTVTSKSLILWLSSREILAV